MRVPRSPPRDMLCRGRGSCRGPVGRPKRLFEDAELDQRVSKQEYAEREPALRAALLAAQARLADSDASLVIVIAGAEGAGKGETVNTLLEWLDARGIEAHALGEPSSEEAERPRFYRFWRRLPPRGQIGIFFGSWYTAPIVRQSLGDSDEDELDRELDRITDFERMLADEGVLLVKLWLHITKKQQRKVFEKLAADPDTAWRVTEARLGVPRDLRRLRRDVVACAAAHGCAARAVARDRRARRSPPSADGRPRRCSRRSKSASQPRPFPRPRSAPLPAPAPVNVLNSLDLGAPPRSRGVRRAPGGAAGAPRATRAPPHGVEPRRGAASSRGSTPAGKGGCIRRIVHALDARCYAWCRSPRRPTRSERARTCGASGGAFPAAGSSRSTTAPGTGACSSSASRASAAPDAWQPRLRRDQRLRGAARRRRHPGLQVLAPDQPGGAAPALRGARRRRATSATSSRAEDWRNREKWLAYEAAACEMIERTSTEIAPWHLVPAEDKLHARVQLLETLCAGLEGEIGADGSGRKRRRKKRR